MLNNLLDTTYKVETPEAIDLNAQLAGPVTRILAFAIDLSFRALILFALSLVLVFAGMAGWGVLLIVWFVLEWFYPVLFEVLRGGQTPGKRRMRIAVVNDDLTPVTWSTSVIRNLLRAADFLPFGYVLGLSAMCTTTNFQRFGDLAAGSLVVHRRPSEKNTATLPDIPGSPPPVPLSLEDQVALTGFAQRHDQLSDSRKQELAGILSEMTGQEGDKGVRYLQSVGNWLLGNR